MRIVWVTGAGSGIGRATAIAFGARGDAVVLGGRRADRLEATAAAIERAGGEAIARPGDLTDPAVVQATADAIGERFGRLDICVNNAGSNVPNRSFAALRPASVDAVLSANLHAPAYVVLAALPLMRGRGAGLFVHVASIDGIRITPVGGPIYGASKHGLVALSHILNLEEGPNGIRSSVVCPGGTDTEILDKRSVPVPADARAKLLSPDDVARVILHIADLPDHVVIDEVTVTPMVAERDRPNPS